MITINKTGRELSKKETYKMTMDPGIMKMRDIVGNVIAVDTFALYEDSKADGKSVEVLSIMDRDGSVFATNSDTFKRDFENIANLMDDAEYEIKVISGTSKSGREFITCTLL